MNIYEITFKDKDAAFFTYARIKNFYKHQNEQAVLPQVRINASTIRVPQQALSLSSVLQALFRLVILSRNKRNFYKATQV